MNETKICINCHRKLVNRKGVWVCFECNSKDIEFSQIFTESTESDNYIFIECPGATLYKEGTNEVEAGVKFKDRDNPNAGYEIVDRPVYAPTHTKRRRIKKEYADKICRCQGCQDYTVRMRRQEGADFFIPSTKYPGRKKLKTVQHISYEP